VRSRGPGRYRQDLLPPLVVLGLSGIARPEMVGALDRLRRGERAGRVLDDRFISGFALAGTAEQVIAQAVQYRRAGADELALSFAGPQPAADAAYFARAVKHLIPVAAPSPTRLSAPQFGQSQQARMPGERREVGFRACQRSHRRSTTMGSFAVAPRYCGGRADEIRC
jgi:hypothetical protein